MLELQGSLETIVQLPFVDEDSEIQRIEKPSFPYAMPQIFVRIVLRLTVQLCLGGAVG